MKKYVLTFLISVGIVLSNITLTNAQFGIVEDIFLQVNDASCVTTECEVILRQYTGIHVSWRLAIRCLDGGGMSDWNYWSGEGVYGGTVCGG
jgi:hypothetical protein